MSEKRALIVDDSKSARVVLSRMLQKYDLAVDTSDSAEQALEYLKAHRPDVIFMDHLMPGMDGLEAVQAIRKNPDTAEIPIMMYTSQEGELYLGQARASGATGVLPKKIGSTEVSKILQDLRLVGDGGAEAAAGAIIVAASGVESNAPVSGTTAAGASPTEADATPAAASDGSADAAATANAANAASAIAASATAATASAGTSTAPGPATAAAGPLAASPDELRALLEPLLKQHAADLRRFVVASLDGFAARVTAETRELVRAVPAPAPVVAPAPVPAPEPPPPAPRPIAWIALAVVALLAAGGAAAYAWQQHGRVAELEARLAAAPAVAAPAANAVPAPAAPAADPAGDAATAAAPSASAATSAPSAVAAAAEAPPLLAVPVPYAEPPLAGARLEKLGALLDDLVRQRARGTAVVTVHTADFCLAGNPAEGYALAPDEMAADRCDVVGNPAYDALRPAQRQPAPYAELVAAVRARTNGALDVRVVEAARKAVGTPYPGEGATAAQWNAAAAANQRIDVVLKSAAPAP